jgi:hypothetical protein
MKKLTIVGSTSPEKIIIRTSLDLAFEILDLLPEQLSISNIGTTDSVVYITDLVDDRTFERLRLGHKSLILISTTKSPNADLSIQIADFQSVTDKILKRVRLISEFVNLNTGRDLSEDHKKLHKLIIERRSPEYIMNTLGIRKTKYFAMEKELRLLLGVEKNWQLSHLAS